LLPGREDVPSEVREPDGQVMRSLSASNRCARDAVAASVRKWSNQEADECAAQIVEIFDLMCKAHQNGRYAAPPLVQLHAVDAQRKSSPRPP